MEAELPLARKFEILLDEAAAAHGRSHSMTALSEDTGLALNTLSRLKTGRIEDPRLSTLRLIAGFFDISLDYFSCRTEDACFEFLKDERRRRSTVPEIATRVREMSGEVMEEVNKMVDYNRMLEDRQSELLETDEYET
jgi:transcriptional regulator with XRE-family HTH domain